METDRTAADGDSIDDAMARQLEERRRTLPNRRASDRQAKPRQERRAICSYCFQTGDHATVRQCLAALERRS
jgi:hypothetical protein